MLKTLTDLHDFIKADEKLFYSKRKKGLNMIRHHIHTSPISDDKYIWNYIETLRYCEYHINNDGFLHKFFRIYYLWKLRKMSIITGFQIPPNTIDKGLTIYHWGPIIINSKTRIGKNCILNPMVVIGHKSPGEPAPRIGNNVFIGAGAKIIGDITIGDNVIIGQNVVVNKSVKSDSIVVVEQPRHIIK